MYRKRESISRRERLGWSSSRTVIPPRPIVTRSHGIIYPLHLSLPHSFSLSLPDLFSRITIPGGESCCIICFVLARSSQDLVLVTALCCTNFAIYKLFADYGSRFLLDVVLFVCLRYYCCYRCCRRSIGNERNWDARESKVYSDIIPPMFAAG